MTTRITLSQAQKCPKCHQAGTITSSVPQARGKLHTLTCENIHCNWWHTHWVVQEDADGMVMVRDLGNEPKTFPKLKRVLSPEEAAAYITATGEELVDPTGP